MKKAVLFFIFVILLTVMCSNTQKDVFYDYFKNFRNVEFCYVTSDSIYSDKNMNSTALVSKIVKNGAKNQLYFKKMNNNIHINADYKQVNFDFSTMQLTKIINDFNINIQMKEDVDNKTCLYGYSSMFKKTCLINGYKINFQLVISNNKVIVGYPLIYGSF